MYCEGRAKPLMRGFFHLLGFCLVVPAKVLSFLIFELNSSVEWLSLSILALGTLTSWGASVLFHCFPWDLRREIALQKLDHSAVFINIACSYSSIAVLVVASLSPEGRLAVWTTIALLWLLCLGGVWHVHAARAQRMKLWIAIVVLTFPSYFTLSAQLTLDERSYCMLGLLLYGLGAAVYGLHLLDPLPGLLGFHEVFHLCTVCATLCAFQMLRSLSQEVAERCEAAQQAHAAFSMFRAVVASTVSSFEDICSNSGGR